jgi:hypothetical protein
MIVKPKEGLRVLDLAISWQLPVQKHDLAGAAQTSAGTSVFAWADWPTCAQFCDDCQRTWWGLESCDEPDEDLEEPSLGPVLQSR